MLIDLAMFEDPTVPVAKYGLDSMIGAELRNWIFKEYALDIPFQQLLGPPAAVIDHDKYYPFGTLANPAAS